eukprot:TRINITY_DN25272_c0_g1_i2.p1 TRINITY_DN25272_c0_g1~~TRINITY_DN25272_c0_g1_i2.p1  ORF type:complete len:108 (-),score=17.83 TRINITY_DN25272_c0_g1_i2:105-428(-)
MIVLIGYLFSYPLRLISALMVLSAWAWFHRSGGMDPAWTPKVGPMELSPMLRLALLTSASFAVLFLTAGYALLNLAGMSAALAACHAAMHPGSVEVGGFSSINEDEL